jgi:7-cyano-7-deazaguanine synthase
MKTVVIHSGGMDSSICLALAIQEFSREQVIGLSFAYDQRHAAELVQARKICKEWGVLHDVIDMSFLQHITSNALLNHSISIQHIAGKAPNTLVAGRNGLMAQIGGIYAHEKGAHSIYMGVMGLEGANSGYRDCSRAYMDLKQQLLRLDLDDSLFEIRTPLVDMTKKETLEVAESLGVLEFLLAETISCYEGMRGEGCGKCPACILRNEGIRQYREANKLS